MGIYTFYRTLKNEADEIDDVRKCLKCLSTYHVSELKDNICPACKIETEKLKGFFDRHPEIENK